MMNWIDGWMTPTINLELKVTLPEGLSAASGNIYIPDDNPLTRARLSSVDWLYFDKRLSSDNTISCGCHDPMLGTTPRNRLWCWRERPAGGTKFTGQLQPHPQQSSILGW